MAEKIKMLFIIHALLISLIFLTITCGQDMRTQAVKLHKKLVTIDTHADTPMNITENGFDMSIYHTPGERGSGKIDLPRMEGNLDAEFFAVFIGQRALTEKAHQEAKDEANQIIDAMENMVAQNAQCIELATQPDDVIHLKKEGKKAAYLGMENGYPIGKDLSLVFHFYQRGIRYITLCHNGNNEICDSSTDEKGARWNGLSPFGEKVAAEMNRLGMIIDLSHTSDSTFYNVIRLSKAPVIASHSCCRALCDHKRNLTDDMIQELAKKGGVIHICFVSSFVKKQPPNPQRDAALDSLRAKYGSYYDVKDPEIKKIYRDAYHSIYDQYEGDKATVKDLVDHIDHVIQLVGEDYVGIGTDFDGGGGVEGCDDVSELTNITLELLERGYSEETIAKIWGGNFLRVFRQIVQFRENIQKKRENG